MIIDQNLTVVIFFEIKLNIKNTHKNNFSGGTKYGRG